MKTPSRLLASAAVSAWLVLGWAAGCGSSNITTRATLGPSGGSLSLPSEGVKLDVPAGALSAPVEVALRASSDGRGVLVAIEPSQLALAKTATLAVSLSRPVHISSVTEISSAGERPLGVEARVENASSTSARLRLDHFTQVRLSTEVPSDGGMVSGACREHEEGDGERHGGGQCDGGTEDDWGKDAGIRKDAGADDDGAVASMTCPSGYQCDDGVCVTPGGNDEEHDGCDGGTCRHDDQSKDGGHR